MKTSKFQFRIFVLLLALLLVGCGAEEPTPVPQPTRTPRPTFTPTPVAEQSQPAVVAVADTATPVPDAPTPTPEIPTETPTPAPQSAKAVITNPQANVRSGPGTGYGLAGTVERGAEFEIVGKNPAGDWYQLCCLNGQRVWIADFLVDTSGPLDGVAVAADIPAPPSPPPAAPTATPAPAQPTATPAPSYALVKGDGVAPQENTNPYITFYGWICPQRFPCSDAVGGYKMVVEGPLGRGEGIFEARTLIGPNDAFWYNVKVEFAGTSPGEYRAWVTDMSGNQVSEAWVLTVSGTMRTLLPRWIAP
ncbi:MAG: SH3 domain-containing protein [Caldilineaceae bacterium]|nr:SH3 domain-containing protein [Caldilineaceae bacterium]